MEAVITNAMARKRNFTYAVFASMMQSKGKGLTAVANFFCPLIPQFTINFGTTLKLLIFITLSVQLKHTLAMNKAVSIATTVLQVLLSLAFLAAGFMKTMTPYEELAAAENMGWVNDFAAGTITAIGVSELVLGLGLLLALFVGAFKKYATIFAAGIACIMIGAAITHLGRSEPITPNIVLFGVAAIVAYQRKGNLSA